MNILTGSEYQAFVAMAKSILKEGGHQLDEWGVDAAIVKWAAYAQQLGMDDAGMGDSVACFQKWVKEVYGQPERVSNEIEISVKITRNYGSVSVEFGETSVWRVTSTAEHFQVVDRISTKLWFLHDEWLRRAAPNLKAVPPAVYGGGGGASEEVVVYHTLVHGFEKGKHVVKLKGGKYEQWGVPLYPEVGVPILGAFESIPMGDSPVRGKMRVQLNAEGKPVKVTHIEPV